MTTPHVAAALKSEETATTKEKIPSDDSLLYVNNSSEIFLKHKRRFCRTEGCNRIVKSQGLCQRHGAKPKTCKVEGCDKQAQGNFDKMCKSHFKAMKRQTTPIPKVEISDNPPPAQGISVYDEILPKSLTFLPNNNKNGEQESENGKEEWNNTMPLILHLKHGFDTLKPPAWHRNEERRARGMFPIDNPAAQLEGWERELVWMEILVLTGVPGASFRQLARAWGRDKGFHMVLAQFICERFGETERKKRHGEKATGECGSSDGKKKRRKTNKAKSKVGSIDDGGDINDVGADVWDPSIYGDVDTNEALAAEIFDFTEKEFERVVSKYKHGHGTSFGSETSSSTRRTSIYGGSASANSDIVAQAAMTAILGEPSTQGYLPVHAPNQHQQDGYYQREIYRDVNQNILPTPVGVVHTMTTSEGEVPVHNHQLQEISETVAAITGVGGYHQQDLPTNPLQGEVYAAPPQMNQLVAPALSQQQQQQQPSPQYTEHQHGHTAEYHQSTIPVIKQEPSMSPQIYEVAQVQVQAHPYQLMQQQQQQQQHHYQASASSRVVTTTSHQIVPAPHQHQLVPAPQQQHQQQEQQHQQLQQQHQPSHFTIPVNVAQPTQEIQVPAITQQMTHVPYTQQQYQQPLLPIAAPVYSPPTQMSQVQCISQQTTYSSSPHQQQQQQPALSLHGFASMPAPQAQAPSVEQQITHVSYPQQEQEQSTRSISHQVVNVSYEQQQQQQQQHQQNQQQLNPVLPSNPTSQLVQHDVPQHIQMFHTQQEQQQQHQQVQQQVQQQHQLQYSQTKIASNDPAQLAQHQLTHLSNPHDHEQALAQAQSDLQIVHHDVSNPHQQQPDQQQTEQDDKL